VHIHKGGFFRALVLPVEGAHASTRIHLVTVVSGEHNAS